MKFKDPFQLNNLNNNERPHQSLWNYTPHQVDVMNNKTELLKQLKCLKIK